MLTNIEAERARLQLTKEDISRELGITSKTYLAYIRGKPIPSNVLNNLSRMFGRSVDYLLGLTTEPDILSKTRR